VVERTAPSSACMSVPKGSLRARSGLKTQYGTREMLMYKGNVLRKVLAPAAAVATAQDDAWGWRTPQGIQPGWSKRGGWGGTPACLAEGRGRRKGRDGLSGFFAAARKNTEWFVSMVVVNGTRRHLLGSGNAVLSQGLCVHRLAVVARLHCLQAAFGFEFGFEVSPVAAMQA